MAVRETNTVYLVGAGPGDPELLTVRAARVLGKAHCILHDDLVSDAVLAMANPEATIINVGKRCGKKSISQAEINELMIAESRRGVVVRLKSGDPLLFGRAGEEMEALREAGVAFEVVPGVSAVFAAAAALRVSLTDRRFASKVMMATVHHAADRQGMDRGEMWNGPLPDDALIAYYMPGGEYAALSARLIAAGLRADDPCAIVSRASSPEQRIAYATVGTLAQVEKLPAPSILLVGLGITSAPEFAARVEAIDLLTRA